jgi:Protein of unknown function (DUF1360).
VLVVSLIVATLAVARITRLLVEDKLMVGYRQWVVKRWGPESLISYLVHCPWCTSVWVSVPVMPAATIWPNQWVIAAFAIPAASMVAGCLLDRD